MKKMQIWKMVIISITAISCFSRSSAEDDNPSFEEVLTGGKPTLNARLRYEEGKMVGREDSQAFTIRTRLGYGTKPIKGLKAFVELEDISSISDEDDYNQAGTNPGASNKTVIADVEGTELN
nr:hypothetical protein [PVC group bacterium]